MPKSTLLLIFALGGLLIIVIALAAQAWLSLDAVELPKHGYIALVLGVVVTLAVGIGLMSLVFYSHRRSYDDAAAGTDPLSDRADVKHQHVTED